MYSPYSSPYTYETSKTVLCATVNNWVGPSANTADGYVQIDIGSFSVACGGSSILSQGGFYTGVFSPGESGTYDLSVVWGGAFIASMSTALGVFGTSHAEGYAIFYFEVTDLTNGEIVSPGWTSYTLYNPGMIDDGNQFVDNSPDLWITLSAQGQMTAGNDYQFMSYVSVYALTDAVGGVDASSVGNFGSGTNDAILVHASWALA
ncbi:MAG: hypothetical protein WBW47_03140 [Thermoplasmata archaeon]